MRTPFPAITGYEVLRPLGEGGMGAVYLATDQTLGRRVAVKVISTRFAGEGESAARFLREARSMATVEHPHIVRIYSFGEVAGQAYLVMEYVEGEDLARRIKARGPLPVEDALRIARQTVEALEAAWEQRIVHRDIKPSNILLDKRNQVRVADFGLAKPMPIAGDAALTQKTYVLGTPHYASPEQVRGHAVDFRSDIYSLGIVLYEMLAGERPFEGTTPFDVVDKQLHATLPSVRKKRPDVSEEVLRLLERMTQKDPAHRPSDYAELRQALDVLLGAPGERLAPALPQVPAWVGTPRGKFVAGAVALVTLLAATGFGWWAWFRPIPQAKRAATKGLVVAVTPFYGPDEDSAKEGKVMAALAEKAITQRLSRHDVKVLGVEDTGDPVRDHQAARSLGERLGANVVVWGEAFALRGETEIQPYFTMVPPKQPEAKSRQEAPSQRAILGTELLAGVQERAAAAMFVQAAAPNQIQLRKTSAAGIGDMALFLAGLHALYTEKDATKALEFFAAAPRTAESLRYRGEALLLLGKRADARAALHEAVALDPRAAQVQALLGELHIEDGRFEEAVVAYRAATQAGGSFTTQRAIFYDGKLYAKEVVKTRPDSAVVIGSPYLIALDPQSGKVLERHHLPELPTVFSLNDNTLQISYGHSQGPTATIGFSQGKFDRPVFYSGNLLLRRDSERLGWMLASNFMPEVGRRIRLGEELTAIPRKVPKKYADFPESVEDLEAAARQAIAKDATQPWLLFVLGQAQWARGREDEAEKTWAAMLAGRFPATPYYEYAWMAYHFEMLYQHQWADRAYQQALVRRKQLAQPIANSFLIERLINVPFFALPARFATMRRSLERVHLWFERARELSGPMLEGDELAAAVWEKYFLERGETEKANREAAYGEQVRTHPANALAAFLRADLALGALAALVLSFFGLLLVIARATGRWRADLAAGPDIATKDQESKARWLDSLVRVALLALAVIIGSGLLILGTFAVFSKKPAGLFLVAIGLLLIVAILYRSKLSPRIPRIPAPSLLIGSISPVERATLATAFLAVLVAGAVAGFHTQTALAQAASPIGVMDGMGEHLFVWLMEERLKSYDTPNRRYVAAVVNHLAGNTDRARELYQSLGPDPRAQKNLAALVQGNLVPPQPLTTEELHRAIVELPWKARLAAFWDPSEILPFEYSRRGVEAEIGVGLLLLYRTILILGSFLLLLFWLFPSRTEVEAQSETSGTRRWLARAVYSVMPGAFDLRHGSPWRGYATLTLAVYVGVVGISQWYVGKGLPGIITAMAVPDFTRFLPLPTPPSLTDPVAIADYHYWTLLWAYPYARVFWPSVAVIGLVALALHLLRLRRFWRT